MSYREGAFSEIHIREREQNSVARGVERASELIAAMSQPQHLAVASKDVRRRMRSDRAGSVETGVFVYRRGIVLLLAGVVVGTSG